MTQKQFAAFMKRMGWSQAQTARELGASRPAIRRWSGVSLTDTGRERNPPKFIALACAELERQHKEAKR